MQQLDDAIILNLLTNMNPERAEIDRVGQLVVRSRTAPHVILNFHSIDFISSTFVNRLIVLRRTVHGAGGKVILCGMNQVIRDIMRINRLEELFDLSDDTDGALEGL
jgi:anti-anti-sigma factor